jgi:hypothetical protein
MKPLDLLRVHLDATCPDDELIDQAMKRMEADAKALAQISEESANHAAYAEAVATAAQALLFRVAYRDEGRWRSGLYACADITDECDPLIAALAKNPTPAGPEDSLHSSNERASGGAFGVPPAGAGTTNIVPGVGSVIPEGWKLVPTEATDEMVANIRRRQLAVRASLGMEPSMDDKWVYRAMLAASPEPPSNCLNAFHVSPTKETP